MKIPFITLFLYLSLCCFHSGAQPKEITLTGIISMATGEMFPYKIVFEERAGKLKGYSITYKTPNDTKTAITGTLDKKLRALSFKENEIIYSHGYNRTKAYMCLVNAAMTYNAGGKGNILAGSLNSAELDKTSCTSGTIMFTNEAEIKDLFSYHEKFDTVISMGKRPREADPKPAPKALAQDAPLVTDKITAGVEKAFDWYSDTVVIDVWDGGDIDGDRVTLLFNDKPYLTNYYLVKEKRRLCIPLPKTGTSTITFVADNEGSDPPNTASILLTDGARRYSILAYNPKGQQSLIRIRRAK